MAHWQNFILPTEYMVDYADEEDLLEGLRPDAYASYLLIYTSNTLLPFITDAAGNTPETVTVIQQGSKERGQCYVISINESLNYPIRFGFQLTIDKHTSPECVAYFISEEGYLKLDSPDLRRKGQFIWICGVLTCLKQMIPRNQVTDTPLNKLPTVSVDTQDVESQYQCIATTVSEDSFMVSTEHGLVEMSTKNLIDSKVIPETKWMITCLKLIDTGLLAIGTAEGSVSIF
jgi:hypothetical protein